jgi:hypothetical protein
LQSNGSSTLFDNVSRKHSDIYVIVSPPRCSSTAFARVFWEHPNVGYYSHEPFEILYYNGDNLANVAGKLERPLDLRTITPRPASGRNGSLVIKEMPYQVGDHFPLLVSLSTGPIIFLIRDPRLNIASRMAMKKLVGDNPLFPLIESGWELIHRQVGWCQENGVDHVIVDSMDYRNHPAAIFEQLFARFQLPFFDRMLSWEPMEDVEIDNLDGQHRHLYQRVMGSGGIEPANEPVPELKSFPIENGFREHVSQSLLIYEQLRRAPARLRVNRTAAKKSRLQ